MKLLLVALLASVSFGAVPVVSGIVVDDIGHSSFRVTWNSDVTPDFQRVGFGPTSTMVSETNTYSPYFNASTQQLVVSGLKHGLDTDGSGNVWFCPQSHNGSGWSTCTPQMITLLAVPSPHPVPPTLPQPIANFPISEPSTAGCTAQTVASDLSDLQAKINTALSNQVSVCQVVTLPESSAGSPYVRLNAAADADTVSAVNTGTNVITLGTARNTYANGDRVRVSSDGFNSISISSGLSESADYCVNSLSGATMKLTTWPGCSSVVSLVSAGGGAWYLMPFPSRNPNYIIIRGNIPLPPENVRVDNIWRTNAPAWGVNCAGINNNICNSLTLGPFNHHIYIKGVDFKSGAGDTTTTDPRPWANHITMRSSNSYIAFDRMWITGAGYPSREYVPIFWEGSAVQFRASAFTNIDYWRPTRSGLGQTAVGAVLTFAGGTYTTSFGGVVRNCTISTFSVTLTSSTAGTAYNSIDPVACTAFVTLPAGTTGTCSSCTLLVGTFWPTNVGGDLSQAIISSCTYSAGSNWACTDRDDVNTSMSVHYFDAIQNIVSCGPGPMLVENIYHQGSGILWHLDDGGVNTTYGQCKVNADQPAANITFRRNRLETPNRLVYGHASSDGLYYRNRHNWECKRCANVLLYGNEFSGSFRDVANDGASVMINGNASSSAAPTPTFAGDVTIDSNWIHDANAGIMTSGGPPGSGGAIPRLGRRFRVVNNIVSNLSGYIYHTTRPIGSFGNGFCFQIGHGGEDVVYDHNTCYSAAGQLPSAMQIISKMVEGFQFTNNALYMHADGDHRGLTIDWNSNLVPPECGGLTGKAGFDCFANSNYNVANNLTIYGFTNSSAMTGDSSASNFATSWASTGSFIPTDSTVAARTSGAGWISPALLNFRFTAASVYKSGGASRATDARDVGVDQDALEDALGWIKNVRALSIAATSFTAAFHAPSVGTACYVGYGPSTDPTTWQFTPADTSSTQERNIVVNPSSPPLVTKTAINFQVWCAGSAPTATLVMRTV